MVVSGSMMLPVSQVSSICTGGSSSSHHKKFENSLSTEEEDLVPTMEDEADGEEEKFPSFCRLLVIKMKNKKFQSSTKLTYRCVMKLIKRPVSCLEAFRSHMTAVRADLTRRDPLEDEPAAAARDGTGQINLFDIPMCIPLHQAARCLVRFPEM
ncbi:hypothetical protein F2Q69_00020383 [Brassica cretica]|uniref:Uncharacterized protein n=1 Tax=Brassica cretica TaxID=69181 RepID=A0A8S9Q652_BRACR|nr:hypothetical protein F2Q69_00020383 [Brassica cretica]